MLQKERANLLVRNVAGVDQVQRHSRASLLAALLAALLACRREQGRGGQGGEGGPGVHSKHGGARWGAAAAVARCISSAGGTRAWVGLDSLATSSGMPQVGGRASPARQQYIRHTRSALPPPCPSFSQARRNTEGHEPSLIMSNVLGSAPGSHTLYTSSSWQRGRGGGGRALSACVVLDGAQKQEDAVGAIECLFKPLYTATSCQGSVTPWQRGGGGGARALAADLVVRPRVQLDAQASLGCHVGGMANQRYGSVTAAEAQLARRLCQLRERDMPEPG